MRVCGHPFGWFLLFAAHVVTLVETAGRPNIVFVFADDLGWNDVGYHGSIIRTPNIDRLAGEGVKLEGYYVQPICTPTRSQFMSGRYQIHTGLQHGVIHPPIPNGLPLEIPTLADLLRKQGYATHIVGKWHLGFYKKEYMPTYRGFDSHFGYLTGAEDYFKHNRCEGEFCGYDLRDNMEEVAKNYSGKYSTHVFAARAQDIIQRHAKSSSEKPLFLYLPFQAVHAPEEVPASYSDLYKGIIKHSIRRTYAGMVTCLDEAIGNITMTLQSEGLWNNTIFIFSTDNGGPVVQGAANNWPLRGSKNTLWEGGVRGVGFVHSDLLATTKGKVIHELIHVTDWLPTLVTLAGGDVSHIKHDGVNAWKSISTGTSSERNELLHNIDPLTPHSGKMLPNSTFDNRVRAAIRSGHWKMLTGDPGIGMDGWYPPPDFFPSETNIESTKVAPVYKNETQNIWLFDVVQDPLEKHDLSSVYPDVVKGLLDKMAAYQKTAVPCRFPDPDPKSDPALHGGAWGPWRE